MSCYSLDGIRPVIHPNAFVHESAVLIGDVIVAAGCYIGPLASLRGDFGRIIMEQGSNVQDCCVLHGFPHSETIVASDGHIGHGAVLHGCRIGEGALVGMNSVVMDNAVIGARSIVAAMSFVKTGFICDERCLVVGAPAVIKRTLSDDEVNWKQAGTREYQDLARHSLVSMLRCEPLTEIEQNRKKMSDSGFRPKQKHVVRDAAE